MWRNLSGCSIEPLLVARIEPLLVARAPLGTSPGDGIPRLCFHLTTLAASNPLP